MSDGVLRVTNHHIVRELRALGHRASVQPRLGEKTLYVFGPEAFADLGRALQQIKTQEQERRRAAQPDLPVTRHEPCPLNGRWVRAGAEVQS
jgi:hypothetical protein